MSNLFNDCLSIHSQQMYRKTDMRMFVSLQRMKTKAAPRRQIPHKFTTNIELVSLLDDNKLRLSDKTHYSVRLRILHSGSEIKWFRQHLRLKLVVTSTLRVNDASACQNCQIFSFCWFNKIIVSAHYFCLWWFCIAHVITQSLCNTIYPEHWRGTVYKYRTIRDTHCLMVLVHGLSNFHLQ